MLETISSHVASPKVLCFGEVLLRLSPILKEEWIRNANVSVYIGGAELNVARTLARWGIPTKFFTAIPDHFVASEIRKNLSDSGVDISSVMLQGDRLGLYYLPQGSELKQAGVIYDRAYSSFWNLQPGTIDWDNVLEGCSWFHWSAITPALNPQLAATCLEAVTAARRKGVTISVDLNYRALLWQYGVQPSSIMVDLLQECDVVMGNIWAAEKLLGIQSPLAESKGKSAQELEAAATESMRMLRTIFPRVKHIAYTFRLESSYFAVLSHNDTIQVSSSYPLTEIVDKVGSGDCFMSALIYGITHQLSSGDMINRAAAAAVGKMQEKGDATSQTMQEIESRMI